MMNSPFSQRQSLLESSRSRHSPRKSLPSSSKATTPSRLYLRQSFSMLTAPQNQQQQKQTDLQGEENAYDREEEEDHTHISTTPKDDPPLSLSSAAAPTSLPVFKMPAALRQRSMTPSVPRRGPPPPPPPPPSVQPLGGQRQSGGLLSALKNHPQQQQQQLSTVLRTTETEYDVSPNRSARLLATPRDSVVGSSTPIQSRQRHYQHLLTLQSQKEDRPCSPPSFPRSPLEKYSTLSSSTSQRPFRHQHGKLQYTTVPTSDSNSSQATLDWIQSTTAAASMPTANGQEEEHHGVDMRYLEQDHAEDISPVQCSDEAQRQVHAEAEAQEDMQDHDADLADNVGEHGTEYLRGGDHHEEEEDVVPHHETYGEEHHQLQDDNLADRRISRGSSHQEIVGEAEAHLLEVAESTTSLTSQLRGVYAHLQEFFSPETEAKLHDAITVLGGGSQSRSDRLSLNGKSTSAAGSTRSTFATSLKRSQVPTTSTRPTTARPTVTKPVPFNFSERLDRLQRKYTPRLGASMASSSSANLHRSLGPTAQQRSSVVQKKTIPIVQEKPTVQASSTFQMLDGSTLTASSTDHHEQQALGVSRQGPFLPLELRKKQLAKNMDFNRLAHHVSIGKKPLTEPKSPFLQTKARAKPSHGLSYEDRVLQDIADRGQLKANTVNRRIFESVGDMGVPKLPKIPLTVPKSPSFTKRKPAPLRSAIIERTTAPAPIAARSYSQQQPRRPEITERRLVSSAESAKRYREDVAAAQREKRREQQRQPQQQQQQQDQTLEEQGDLEDHYDDDGVEHDQQQQQRRLPQPPPPPPLPSLRGHRTTPIPPTVPEPFRLETEVRGEMHRQQFEQKLQAWKRLEHTQRLQQRALTSSMAAYHPSNKVFVPKKSTKPLTVSEEIALQTELRIEARHAYEHELRQKERLLQEMLAEKAREDEHREQRELQKLRQQTIIHANPIRHYPSIEIHRSDKPLTVPRSPLIGEKRKWRNGGSSVLGSSSAVFKRSRYEHEQQQEQHHHRLRHHHHQEQERYDEQEDEEEEEPVMSHRRRPMGRKSWLEANDL